MDSQPNMLGKGIYTFAEAARLTGVQSRTLRRWVRGYAANNRAHPPLFTRDLPDVDGEAALSFLDLIEVKFVSAFRSHGVTWPEIRRAAEKAAELFDTRHPFCVKRFRTDGRSIFAELVEEGVDNEHLMSLAEGQVVFRQVFEPLMKQLDYDIDTDDVISWSPLGKNRPVVVDPSRSRGTPITRESGVPTHILYNATVANDGDLRRVAHWYGASLKEIRAAVDFESSFQVKHAA